MSFVATVYTREGIVMAADSRLSLNTTTQPSGQQPIQQLGVGMSDSASKLFLAPGRVGISTFGAADIGGVPISGFIESFINGQLSSASVPVDAVARQLLAYFQSQGAPSTSFHVAGYKDLNDPTDQQVWTVDVTQGAVTRSNPAGNQGLSWGGEGDVIKRVLAAAWEKDGSGGYQQLPSFQIPWQFFTLQDAIDFAVYAIKTTIDTMRFQARPKSVGGPIDVLVIRPTDAQWVAKKQLHA